MHVVLYFQPNFRSILPDSLGLSYQGNYLNYNPVLDKTHEIKKKNALLGTHIVAPSPESMLFSQKQMKVKDNLKNIKEIQHWIGGGGNSFSSYFVQSISKLMKLYGSLVEFCRG